VLFVLVVVRHDRRQVIHFNVTGHPGAGEVIALSRVGGLHHRYTRLAA
jgi:hypothetical protein